MTLADYCEFTGLEPSYDVILAASFLQAKGWRFSIDFAMDDAIEKATALMYPEPLERKPQ